MKKMIFTILLMIPLGVIAENNKELGNRYFSKDIPRLSHQEQQALKLAKQWQKGGKGSKPFQSSDGSVRFVYGSGQTKIVCAPLQVCDIALQPGEHFNDMNVGDPRFIVEPSITGMGSNQQIHTGSNQFLNAECFSI